MYLRNASAATVLVGPVVSVTDGVTPVTNATLDIRVGKNNGVFAARNAAGSIFHQENGWYSVPLSDVDTDTNGRIVVAANDAASYLPVWHEYTVIAQASYDALITASVPLSVTTSLVGPSAIVSASFASNSIIESALDAGLFARLQSDVDALIEQSMTEIATTPSATPGMRDGLMLLYMALRNRLDVTGSLKEVHNDAGTVVTSKVLSKTADEYSEAKMT